MNPHNLKTSREQPRQQTDTSGRFRFQFVYNVAIEHTPAAMLATKETVHVLSTPKNWKKLVTHTALEHRAPTLQWNSFWLILQG